MTKVVLKYSVSNGCKIQYQPFCNGLSLRLNQDDIRLAVTETVTAKTAEIHRRDHEMHWKLAYDLLRCDIQRENTYKPIMPIKKVWLKQSFNAFCRTLADREQLILPPRWDEQHYLELGQKRQNEFLRLSIPRQTFRRIMELWLILDMRVLLETHGYQVKLSQFCPANLSPRNIMIQAVRL